MTALPPESFALPVEAWREIDEICNGFEQQLKTNNHLPIEEHLAKHLERGAADSPGSYRSALLHELLAHELEHKRKHNRPVDAQDYRRRFPDDAAILDALLGPPTPTHIGRYRVIRLLGEGRFGRVFLARDETAQREVAVKVLRQQGFGSQQEIERFLHDARTAARLNHAAIVPVYDVCAGQPNNESGAPGAQAYNSYVVLRYMEGGSLADLLDRRRLTATHIVELMTPIAKAVEYAHQRQIVHRDLKPANILLDAAGRPFIADFGLAVHERDQHRQAGEVSGAPAYMSPEQVRGQTEWLDGRSDIWSLGVILYEMLTRRRPFAGETVDELFNEILNREPRPPRQIDQSIPKELERICLKCLSKNIADRYTTAGDLAVELMAPQVEGQVVFRQIEDVPAWRTRCTKSGTPNTTPPGRQDGRWAWPT